jgi:hypothetical protein
MIIHGRDDTGFLHDLAVVVIHGVEMLRPIHHGGQGCTTALVLLVDGDRSPIDLEHHVLCRSGTLLW